MSSILNCFADCRLEFYFYRLRLRFRFRLRCRVSCRLRLRFSRFTVKGVSLAKKRQEYTIGLCFIFIWNLVRIIGIIFQRIKKNNKNKKSCGNQVRVWIFHGYTHNNNYMKWWECGKFEKMSSVLNFLASSSWVSVLGVGLGLGFGVGSGLAVGFDWDLVGLQLRE